jgi:hypothetical protein
MNPRPQEDPVYQAVSKMLNAHAGPRTNGVRVDQITAFVASLAELPSGEVTAACGRIALMTPDRAGQIVPGTVAAMCPSFRGGTYQPEDRPKFWWTWNGQHGGDPSALGREQAQQLVQDLEARPVDAYHAACMELARLVRRECLPSAEEVQRELMQA